MGKDGQLHAGGDLLGRTMRWWAASNMKSKVKDVTVCGDGGVRVHWDDGEETGKYFISGQLLYAKQD